MTRHAPDRQARCRETWITAPAEVSDVPGRIVKPAGPAETPLAVF
jgi:hypothetical protein